MRVAASKELWMKRALITGIAGQDGYYLAKYLHEQHGYRLFGLGRSLHPDDESLRKRLPFVTVLPGDLLDSFSLIKACDAAEPDEVYNLGGQSSVELSFSIPELTQEINGDGVLRILESSRMFQERTGNRVRIYQASSSEMFGRAGSLPCNERTRFRPQSPYGSSKVQGHHHVDYYRSAYGMFVCSGICFNHESPVRGPFFASRKITRGVARIRYGQQSELILGNLRARRDWGYAGDYVKAMWRMLQRDQPDDYIIATGESHSVEEFVNLAFEIADVPRDQRRVAVDPKYKRPLDVEELLGDASKANQELGWKPEVSFVELVRMMVERDLEEMRLRAA
jgi:GDPmannose 4,6-dehydratase